MPEATAILGPVVGLNLWTFFMEGWMYARRLPAMGAAKDLKFSSETAHDDLKKLPPQARWVAENYNHLFEQPTQFYAIALTIAFLGRNKGVADLDVKLAWTYVAIRMIHSVVQSTSNTIPVRFSLFALSGLVLGGMSVRTALEVFQK